MPILSVRGTSGASSLLLVSDEMRAAAAARRGDWEITTYEKIPGSSFYLWDHTVIKVRLTEKELQRPLHHLLHGARSGIKETALLGNVEHACQTMYPTGSLEHVAMRFLLPAMLVRYMDCQYSTVTYNPITAASIAATTAMVTAQCCKLQPKTTAILTAAMASISAAATYCLPKQYRTTLKRIDRHDDHMVEPPPETGSGINSSPEGGVSESIEPGPETPSPVGNTPQAAEILAQAEGNLRRVGELTQVIGAEYTNEDQDTKKIVGALVAPIAEEPLVYACTETNARAAVQERLVKNELKFTGTTEDRKKLDRFMGAACGEHTSKAVFSTARIQAWAEKNLDFKNLKSGKWSDDRLERSLTNLLQKSFPEFRLAASVKLEPMAKGKPPRLLIADGDDGQLMALLTVKCFEDLVFEWFEDRSIKHVGKREAVQRVVTSLTKKGAGLIEGDGKAWDTCCNTTIRDLTENRALRHIMQVLIPYGIAPEAWERAHEAVNSKKQLKLFFDKAMQHTKLKINAIRRSGHRGTSCLNWWMNHTLWLCAIFKEPERFLDVRVRTGEDVTGTKRWWNGNMEGDDSICAMCPKMRPGDALSKQFEGFWKRMGFRMTIVYIQDEPGPQSEKRATYVGWHLAAKDGEPTGHACPDVTRLFKKCGVSCSASAIEAATYNNERGIRMIASAKAMAIAYNYAGILPTISEKFLEWATRVNACSPYDRNFTEREMSMQVCGKEGMTTGEISERVMQMNGLVTPTDELQTMKALGYDATDSELDAFRTYLWDFSTLWDHKSFRDSVPLSWR